MSKYQTTQYNHFARCKQAMGSIYNMAKHCKMTHSQIIERAKEYIYDTNSYKKLNGYYRAHLSGMAEAYFHDLYKYDLTWMHFYTNKNGKVIHVTKWDKMPKYIRYDDSKFESNHFWNDSLKPF